MHHEEDGDITDDFLKREREALKEACPEILEDLQLAMSRPQPVDVDQGDLSAPTVIGGITGGSNYQQDTAEDGNSLADIAPVSRTPNGLQKP